MYLHNIPSVNYVAPWNLPVEDRLQALERGKQRVAYISLLPDYLTFRYRAYNMVQALQGSVNGTSAAYFTDEDLPHLEKATDIADVIVVCRTKYFKELGNILNRAHGKGKTIFFDVDDLIFDPKYVPQVLNAHDLNANDSILLDNWYAHVARLNATMQLCDRGIATNAYLAAHMQPHFDEKISVIPNFLNREQIEISGRIYNAKKSSSFAHTGPVHLGYFSGTPSHRKDFAVAAEALARTLEENPQVVLRLVGHLDIEGQLQNFLSRIERYPFQDFVNLQRQVGEVEVNLIPLQESDFTNCKSELKFFEAGIVGTMSIASPRFSYSTAIVDGKNGFLADSSQWYEKIQNVLELIGKPAEAEIAESAMNYSLENYSPSTYTERIESILFRQASTVPTPADGTKRLDPIQIQATREENASNKGVDLLNLLQKAYQDYDCAANTLFEREQTINVLNAELEEIHKSRAWKLTTKYRQLRYELLPMGSLQENLFFLPKNILFMPKMTIWKLKKFIHQTIYEPQGKVIKAQDRLIGEKFSQKASKLIVFLVPGVDTVNGGIMSMCSIAKVTQSLKPIHDSEVLIMTLPAVSLFRKYTYFENPFDVYRFEQLYSYFTEIEELTLQIPENFIVRFLANLTEKEKDFLKAIRSLRINILNQNVLLMPSPVVINELKQIAHSVTCSTAHSKYCTKELRKYYGIPFHHFSASNLTDYYYSPYKNKENLMIISNDVHPTKIRILKKIRQVHPEIKIVKIEDMTYEDYKRLLSRTKWAITFGEGIDGYFVESIRSGAIPFAVYNKEFFGERFDNLPNVYKNYEEMLNNISKDLSELDNPESYEPLSKRLISIDAQEYNDQEYKDNIRRFYLGEYDIP